MCMDNVKIPDYTMTITQTDTPSLCHICKNSTDEMYIFRYNHHKSYYCCRSCIQKILLYASLMGDDEDND